MACFEGLPVRKPLLSKKNMVTQFRFAKLHLSKP